MSHMIETIAYTGETPWHGLGVEVDRFRDVPHMMEAAGLNWTVEKRPLFAGLSDDTYSKALDDKFALVRNTDNSVLDVVGRGFKPTQNKQALEFFHEFTKAGHATLETAGSIDDGRYVWGLARLGSDFELAGGDKVEGFMLIALPHKLGVSIQVKYTPVRVVCNNTLTLALRQGKSEFRMRHTSIFDAGAYKDAMRALGVAREQTDTLKEVAATLTKIHVNRDHAKRILLDVFNPALNADAAEAANAVENEEKSSRVVNRILNALDYAPGWDMSSAQDTAWGLLNAATFVASHGGSNQNNRVRSLWFGQNGQRNEKLLGKLLTLAD